MSAHAAHAAALANATKASGTIVRLEPMEWLKILKRLEDPLVVIAPGGLFRKKYRYLTSYRGLAFFTASDDLLPLPSRVDVISAKSIWVPDH